MDDKTTDVPPTAKWCRNEQIRNAEMKHNVKCQFSFRTTSAICTISSEPQLPTNVQLKPGTASIEVSFSLFFKPRNYF